MQLAEDLYLCGVTGRRAVQLMVSDFWPQNFVQARFQFAVYLAFFATIPMWSGKNVSVTGWQLAAALLATIVASMIASQGAASATLLPSINAAIKICHDLREDALRTGRPLQRLDLFPGEALVGVGVILSWVLVIMCSGSVAWNGWGYVIAYAVFALVFALVSRWWGFLIRREAAARLEEGVKLALPIMDLRVLGAPPRDEDNLNVLRSVTMPLHGLAAAALQAPKDGFNDPEQMK